jgi:hypothetical protein
MITEQSRGLIVAMSIQAHGHSARVNCGSGNLFAYHRYDVKCSLFNFRLNPQMYMQFSFHDMAPLMPYHRSMMKMPMFIARQRRRAVLLQSAVTELEWRHSS